MPPKCKHPPPAETRCISIHLYLIKSPKTTTATASSTDYAEDTDLSCRPIVIRKSSIDSPFSFLHLSSLPQTCGFPFLLSTPLLSAANMRLPLSPFYDLLSGPQGPPPALDRAGDYQVLTSPTNLTNPDKCFCRACRGDLTGLPGPTEPLLRWWHHIRPCRLLRGVSRRGIILSARLYLPGDEAGADFGPARGDGTSA